MEPMEKRQELSSAKIEMLQAMGITVWHSRGLAKTVTPLVRITKSAHKKSEDKEPVITRHEAQSISTPEPTVELSAGPASEQTAQAAKTASDVSTAQFEPLAFSWVKGAQGMLVYTGGADNGQMQLAKDIVVYIDWLHTRIERRANQAVLTDAPSIKPAKRTSGDFRWPQLLDSGGTPARSLAVFFDKHLAIESMHSPPWVAVSADAMQQLGPWLQDLALGVIEVPPVAGQLVDAAKKKQIWLSLQPSK